MIKSSKNPQAMINNMLNNNPQYKQVNDLIKQSNGDAKQAFYNLAKQKGVNPDDILNMLK